MNKEERITELEAQISANRIEIKALRKEKTEEDEVKRIATELAKQLSFLRPRCRTPYDTEELISMCMPLAVEFIVFENDYLRRRLNAQAAWLLRHQDQMKKDK